MSPIAKVPVANQPVSLNTMDVYYDNTLPSGEKHLHTHHHAAVQHSPPSTCECGSQCPKRKLFQNSRLRRCLFVAIPALLIFLMILAGSYYLPDFDFFGLGVDGLVKRNGATGSTTGNNGNLTHHKYYLIIVFVGLFLVVVLGIMLSAWCCKGSFENPLCCPCYLCACCGGLACLECIACGLCAEGIEQA